MPRPKPFRRPDGFRAAIRTNHNSDAPLPRKSHRKAGGIPGRAQRTAATALPEQAVQQRRQPVSGFQHLRLGELVRENDEVARLLVRKRLTSLGPVVDHAALAGAVGQPVAGRAFGDIASFPLRTAVEPGARIPDNTTCCSA